MQFAVRPILYKDAWINEFWWKYGIFHLQYHFRDQICECGFLGSFCMIYLILIINTVRDHTRKLQCNCDVLSSHFTSVRPERSMYGAQIYHCLVGMPSTLKLDGAKGIGGTELCVLADWPFFGKAVILWQPFWLVILIGDAGGQAHMLSNQTAATAPAGVKTLSLLDVNTWWHFLNLSTVCGSAPQYALRLSDLNISALKHLKSQQRNLNTSLPLTYLWGSLALTMIWTHSLLLKALSIQDFCAWTENEKDGEKKKINIETGHRELIIQQQALWYTQEIQIRPVFLTPL